MINWTTFKAHSFLKIPTGISTHSLKVPSTFEGDKYLYAGLSCLACPLTIQRLLPGVNYPLHSLVLPLVTLPTIHPTTSLQAPIQPGLVSWLSQDPLLKVCLFLILLLPEWTSTWLQNSYSPFKAQPELPHLSRSPPGLVNASSSLWREKE